MLNKLFVVFITFFNIVFLYYLAIPTPTLPGLYNAVQSREPGDTIQLKNVSAFYTNMTRTEVMNFYKAKYTGPFRIIINHPPEKAKEIIRDTTQSYYLEEFILPFKESLFVNGYEWENDVFTKPEKRIINQLKYDGKIYKAKITLKSFPTTIYQRIINFLISQLGVILIILIFKSFFSKKRA